MPPPQRSTFPGHSLTRIVSWSQLLTTELLTAGDTAVDLTAGKGRDTLALAEAVGHSGRVIAIDVQAEALAQTSLLLTEKGYVVHPWQTDRKVPEQPGIYLIQGCHSRLSEALSSTPRAVIANLGYLPGGNRQLITQTDTTLAALSQALDLLSRGGRLAVVLYPGHDGGAEEAQEVTRLFRQLNGETWQVLELSVANQSFAPRLLLAERR